MTEPSRDERVRAFLAGKAFGRARKPLTDSPYKASGDDRQRVLNQLFVRGYAEVSDGTDVDFDDKE